MVETTEIYREKGLGGNGDWVIRLHPNYEDGWSAVTLTLESKQVVVPPSEREIPTKREPITVSWPYDRWGNHFNMRTNPRDRVAGWINTGSSHPFWMRISRWRLDRLIKALKRVIARKQKQHEASQQLARRAKKG